MYVRIVYVRMLVGRTTKDNREWYNYNERKGLRVVGESPISVSLCQLLIFLLEFENYVRFQRGHKGS